MAAAGTIYLYGPDDLGDAATNLSNIVQTLHDGGLKESITEHDLHALIEANNEQFNVAMGEFVRVARKHLDR